jgi:hypothetical protein
VNPSPRFLPRDFRALQLSAIRSQAPKAGHPAKALDLEFVASLKKTLAEFANREVLGGQYAQLLLSRLSLFSLW